MVTVQPEVRVGVIMPARNVESMVGTVLESLTPRTWGWVDQMVVIDNGSEDGTCERVREFLRDNPERDTQVVLLENGRNIGYGGSIKRGLLHFETSSCDYVVIVHSDDQCDHNAVIDDLVSTVRKKPSVEAVLGVRVAKSGPSGAGFNSYRSFGNGLVTIAGRVLTGSRARDINTPITLLQRAKIGDVPVEHLTSGILLHPQLNTVLTTERRFAFAEVEVQWWDASLTERRPLNRMGLAILWGFLVWCLSRRILRRPPAAVLDRINRVEVREDYSSPKPAGGRS